MSCFGVYEALLLAHGFRARIPARVGGIPASCAFFGGSKILGDSGKEVRETTLRALRVGGKEIGTSWFSNVSR